MPWDQYDVARKNKMAAKVPRLRKMWASTADSALAWAQKKGVANPEAAAIRIANSQVKKQR